MSRSKRSKQHQRVPSRASSREAVSAVADGPPDLSPLRAVGLALLSGFCFPLATASIDIWPLGWVAMVPLFYAVHRTRSTRRATLYAWLAGTATSAGGFYWLAGMLARFGKLPMPIAWLGMLLLAAYQGLIVATLIFLARRMRTASNARFGGPLPMALLAPVIIAALETIWPVLFPYYLGIAQAWVTPVIQIADITGPTGVSAAMLMVSGAIFDIATLPARRQKIRIAAVTGTLVALLVGYGLLRMHQVDARRAAAPRMTIGLLQTNLAFFAKGTSPASELAAMQKQSQALEARGAELIVWPESSFPYRVSRSLHHDLPPSAPQHIRRGLTVPLVIGAVTVDPKTPDERPYNSAVMIDRDGAVRGLYDKIFLLVFGEYTPFYDTFDWVKRMVPAAAGHFRRGQEVVTFPFEKNGVTYRLGPMICYEDIVTDFGRKLATMHPHLLVNLTNDAWFGDTTEPWEHLALSVFRAVELRTDLARSVNTGVSALVDASGRVYEKTYAVDPGDRILPMDGLVGEVALLEGGYTFYARFGDLFGYLCLLLTIYGTFLLPRRRART